MRIKIEKCVDGVRNVNTDTHKITYQDIVTGIIIIHLITEHQMIDIIDLEKIIEIARIFGGNGRP